MDQEVGGQAQIKCVCTRDRNGALSLRYGASQAYGVVKRIPNGAAVQPVAIAKGNDGFIWNRVYHGNSVGWVRGDYLCS